MIKKRILFVMVTALLICTALCGCGAKKAARPAATAEPAATVKPVTTPKPTPTPTPTPSPTPTPEPTPEPTPDPAKHFINIDTSDLINITKNPGGEYVTPGSTAMFISTADGAESYEWRFVAPDYESEVVWNAEDLQQRFPGLYTFNGETNTLTISGIPLELNGWYAVCLFTDSGGGMTASEGAKIEVAGASPVLTEAEKPAESNASEQVQEQQQQAVPKPEQTQTAETATEPAHTHSYSATTVAASCENGGYTLYSCSCGDSYKDGETPALGHDWVATTERTVIGSEEHQICGECGLDLTASGITGDGISDHAKEHVMAGGGGRTYSTVVETYGETTKYVCSRCGAVQ